MADITSESLIAYLENIEYAYQHKQRHRQQKDLTELIKHMRSAIKDNPIKDNNNNANKELSYLLQSVTSVLEMAFRKEREKYYITRYKVNGTGIFDADKDKKFIDNINFFINAYHYPRLLGLALKEIYAIKEVVPDKELVKLVLGINPLLTEIYQLEPPDFAHRHQVQYTPLKKGPR